MKDYWAKYKTDSLWITPQERRYRNVLTDRCLLFFYCFVWLLSDFIFFVCLFYSWFVMFVSLRFKKNNIYFNFIKLLFFIFLLFTEFSKTVTVNTFYIMNLKTNNLNNKNNNLQIFKWNLEGLQITLWWKFGLSKIFCSSRLLLFNQKFSKNVKYYYNLK